MPATLAAGPRTLPKPPWSVTPWLVPEDPDTPHEPAVLRDLRCLPVHCNPLPVCQTAMAARACRARCWTSQAPAPPVTRPTLDKTRTYRLLCSTEDSKSICPLSFPSPLLLWPVPHPPLVNQSSAVEARQIAQQRAQITPRDQQTSLGKLSYQYQHQGTAFFFSRPELRLSGTPVTRPPPEPPPAAEEGTADSDPDAKTKTVPWTNAVSSPQTTHPPTPVVNQPGDT